MNNYKKIEIVGKGSFGYAVLVQSVLDGNYYIMKVPRSKSQKKHFCFLIKIDHRCIKNGSKTTRRSLK